MTLQKQLKNEKVRYSLAVGRLTLQPLDSRVVQLSDGTYAKVPTERIVLERDGGRLGPAMTRVYDPSLPADKAIIDFVDNYIEEHPEVSTSGPFLYKMGEFDPVKPFPTFDEVDDVKVIETMIINNNSDLAGVMKYELAKDNPRPSVVKLLERLEKQKFQEESDASAEGLDL